MQSPTDFIFKLNSFSNLTFATDSMTLPYSMALILWLVCPYNNSCTVFLHEVFWRILHIFPNLEAVNRFLLSVYQSCDFAWSLVFFSNCSIIAHYFKHIYTSKLKCLHRKILKCILVILPLSIFLISLIKLSFMFVKSS